MKLEFATPNPAQFLFNHLTVIIILLNIKSFLSNTHKKIANATTQQSVSYFQGKKCHHRYNGFHRQRNVNLNNINCRIECARKTTDSSTRSDSTQQTTFSMGGQIGKASLKKTRNEIEVNKTYPREKQILAEYIAIRSRLQSDSGHGR